MPTTKKKSGGTGGNGAVLMEAPAGLEQGSSGKDVKSLQNYLRRFGYLGHEPTAEDGRVAELDLRPTAEEGEFDDATEEALRRFQEMARLPVTGELDEATVPLPRIAERIQRRRRLGRGLTRPRHAEV